jgi:hypothetical protein
LRAYLCSCTWACPATLTECIIIRDDAAERDDGESAEPRWWREPRNAPLVLAAAAIAPITLGSLKRCVGVLLLHPRLPVLKVLLPFALR